MAERSKRIELYDSNLIPMINAETIKLFNKYKIDMSLRELSEKTIYNYTTDLYQWFIYIYQNQSNQCITELDEDDVTEFIWFCKQQGNNTRRIKRRMSSISAFYKYLRKKRIINENPCEFIDRPRKDTDVLERLFLTEEQVENMKEEIKKLDNLQLLLYVSLSLSTMARVNAISNITWKQIDFEHRVISNVLEKEQRIVDLFFSQEVKDLLLQWKKERENKGIFCDYVFITYYGKEFNKASVGTLTDWARDAGILIGVDNCHPHTFRKTGATILKNRGASLESVSKLLNHLSTDVSRKFYIKENTQQLQDEKDKYGL
jgi:site-specific recombinase XerD